MKTAFIRRLGMGLLAGLAVVVLLRLSLAISEAAKSQAQAAEAGELRIIQSRGDGIYWNEQANAILHQGSVSKAFELYEKAVAAYPDEPVIWQNFAVSVFLYRKDAMAYYRLNEQEVYDKAFVLYDQAMRADPENFALATDMAMSYYAVKPQRPNDALRAWQKVLKLADTEAEQQSIYVHLARTLLNAGRADEAKRFLDKVATPENATMKEILARRLRQNEGTRTRKNHST